MVSLTEQDLRKRLSVPGLTLSLDEKLYPFFSEPDADCFAFDFPERASSLPFLARSLSLLAAKEETYFGGAFLWYALWSIGSPQLDRIGWCVVEKMRLANGETRPIEASPVLRFRDDESIQLQAFLLQPFVFQWDANLIYPKRDRFVHVSHDGFVVVAGKTKAVRDECWSALVPFGPSPVSENVRARFCRSGVAAGV